MNFFGQCGRTTLHGSFRLGRYTQHHLRSIKYTQECHQCSMKKVGQTISFSFNRVRKVIRAPGTIMFLSYPRGKSECPINAWCLPVSKSAVCWVKCVSNTNRGRRYRQYYRTQINAAQIAGQDVDICMPAVLVVYIVAYNLIRISQ